MGRPPCCDKVGIKKGPWTPEEDIILVSYIQEHGPGNWRSVPTNTGINPISRRTYYHHHLHHHHQILNYELFFFLIRVVEMQQKL